MKSRSGALSYFGSDAAVAKRLATEFQTCKHVTIPFCGGMSILPHLRARTVVANDANHLAIHFYKVVSGCYGYDEQQSLVERCMQTLSHPGELQLARQVLDDWNSHMKHLPALLAWSYWVLCWVGRKGAGGTSKLRQTQISVRWEGSGGNNASRLASVAGDLLEWAEHFRRCEWTCLDFREVLRKAQDKPGNGIYCDPPWVGAGKLYEHSFRKQDHLDLHELLSRFRHATVIVRYGDHPRIRELYADDYIVASTAARDQRNQLKGEIWMKKRRRNEEQV